ncbi:type V secretory pathway%2C adhesin AidA [Yersinia kristensenii]|uniref:autotransporter outer membrane beta-barrel domain-containing protein n=1 Tax=Yersinia rochesterensis TaxID=1604335 RepID=UPI00065B3844|nr:autotransporter outer membrane beta-barrel domain-containing protein [Yersinia rochesterensis]CRY64609.1 type V secretory pathway%2C adhesin AidA [Yersinia kristensenii]
MYISNIIQPNGRTHNISSNDARYSLSPCAKAISALLLVFSSTFAWADDNTPTVDTAMTSTPPPPLIPGQDIPQQREISNVFNNEYGGGNELIHPDSHNPRTNSIFISSISHMLEAGATLPEFISELNLHKKEIAAHQEELARATVESEKYSITRLPSILIASAAQHSKIIPFLSNSLANELRLIGLAELDPPKKPKLSELATLLQKLQQASASGNKPLITTTRKKINKLKNRKEWEQLETGKTPLSWDQEVKQAYEEIRNIPVQLNKEIGQKAQEKRITMQMLDKLYDGEIEKEKTLVRKITKPLNNILPTTVVNDVYQEIESIFDDATIKAAAAKAAEKAAAEKAAAEKAAAEKAAAEKAAIKPVVPKPAPIIGHNPQVGSYIANQIAAQQMFITDDLQHRQGETRYIDPVTGEGKVSSLWINTSGAKNRFNSGNDQLRTKSNRYAIQLGGTLNKWSSGGDDQGILGITAGFGKSTNHSHSTSSHHQAQGSVDGYNLGLYSIWYADNQTRLGPYIDLLAQYGWFNNQIKAPNVTTAANYKSYLFTSALETGYKIQLLETADTKLSLQPRAKVMWQRTSGLLHKEPNAILINIEEDNAVTTKLGMRTVLELDIDTLSSAKNLQISPSFEANWIHSRVNQGVQLSRAYTTPQRVQDKIELVSVNVSPQGNSNIADLKLGIEANIDSNLRLWTYLGHQFGGHNYSDTQATIGMNYRF